MIARYLQDQERGLDIGSLLMGFLDFYGNYFDPRSTAISVRHRMVRPASSFELCNMSIVLLTLVVFSILLDQTTFRPKVVQ